MTGSNVFAAGDGEDHLTVDFSDQTQNLSTFNMAGNNFAGAVGVNSWNGDFGNGAGVRFDNVDTFTLLGGSGDDTLIGRSGDDQLSGSAGNDVLDEGSGNDTVSGGDGDDQMFTTAGVVNVDSGPGGCLDERSTAT